MVHRGRHVSSTRAPRGPIARRLRLAFVDPEIEQAFRRYDDTDSRPRRTVMCLLGGGFWMVFGLLDRELMSDASRFLPVRAAVTGIVIASALVLWRDVARTAHETIACGVVLAFAWASDFGALTTDVPAYYVAGGNLMAALALFTLAGVRVRAAVVTGLLLIADIVRPGDDHAKNVLLNLPGRHLETRRESE